MKFILFFIAFSLIFGRLKAQQNDVFVVNENDVNTHLNGFIFEAKNLKINRIEDLIFTKKVFKKAENSLANFGYGTDENWIYFDLKNEDLLEKKLVLFLDQTFLEKADFYLFRGDSLGQKYELNYLLSGDKRPFGFQNFVYPFSAKPTTNYSIFLRIKPTKNHSISRALITLSDEKSFFSNQKKHQLIFGILIGFLLFSFVVGLILFYNSPKPIYVIYGVYILVVLAFYLSNNGFLNANFPHNLLGSPQFSNGISMLGAAVQVLFIHQFLALPSKISRFSNQLILFIIGYFILLAFIYLFSPIPAFLPLISRYSLIFLGIFLISLCIWTISQKNKVAYLYLFAILPGIFLVAYFLLSALKILPLYFEAFALPFSFSVYEIIVFGFGLVYVFTKEKQETERQLAEIKQNVAHQIIKAQEQERQRIAQDLHDDLGSTLSMLKNKLSESNETLDNQLIMEIKIADKAVEDLREISQNLMPVLFLQKGLKGAIQELITLSNIEFLTSGNEKKLDWEVELSIFRIAKELLNNAIKHAKASKIEVNLIYFDDFLYLSVEDNGCGFRKYGEEITGIGLKNISLRVDYLNGKMNQETSEKGTLISIEIPYGTKPKDQNLAD